MTHFQESIVNCLKDLKGSGKFVSANTADFVFPGLVVAGLGEITYPISEPGAQALIGIARKAPFGKGNKTIVDSSVRNTWEIDASELRFDNPRWLDFLDKAIDDVKQGLGLEDYEISAHLYKMLIYETGSFFLTHRDSEKEKGMFGTLVVELPAYHTGGELVVSFEGAEEVLSFAQSASNYKLSYAAFYADCEHEIMPVKSGYRVSLVYNLVQKGAGRKIVPESTESHSTALAELLKAHQQRPEAKPAIILLGHQYTPENFSADTLKLNDRPKAEVLLQAASKAGYYSKMCLVTSYLIGIPDIDGYLDEDNVNDAVMEEVLDGSLSIDHWLPNKLPPLSLLNFEEDDLITSFPLNEGEAVLKETTGYQGNYGPDLEHWYHYGAVVIWSPDNHSRLLLQQDTKSKLAWIGYLLENREQTTESELAAVSSILSEGFSSGRGDKDADYSLVADWIINEQDEDFFLRIAPAVTQSYFLHIDAAVWLRLIQFLGEETSAKIFAIAAKADKVSILEQLLAILNVLLDSGQSAGLLGQQLELLPGYFSEAPTDPKNVLTAAGLKDLFRLESQRPQPAVWVRAMEGVLTQSADRDFVHRVLAPPLLMLNWNTSLSIPLLTWCEEFLQRLTATEPQPPANWRREMPVVKGHQKEWRLLSPFLDSPDASIFDYRANQSERNEMENAIRGVVIDLKTETIKKGSPYTLKITKTQTAYQRQVKIWNEDLALLNLFAQKTAESSIGKD